MFFGFQFFTSGKVQAKQLHELPDDVLALIFAQLKIPDQFNLIECDRAFQRPVNWAFRNRLVKYDGSSSHEHIEDKNGVVIIQHLNALMKVFENFGTSMKRLYINYNFIYEDESAKISRAIRERFYDQLEYLGIDCGWEKLLYESRFPKVLSVTLKGVESLNKVPIYLTENFPKMKSLELNQVKIRTSGFLNLTFRHLQHLEVYFDNTDGLKQSEIVGLLEMNPQIKSMKIKSFLMNFLRDIETNLPDLEILDIDWDSPRYPAQIGTFQFENVKKFTFKTFYNAFQYDVIPFAFGNQLEELKVIWKCEKNENLWDQFMKRNPNIQKFSISFPRKRCDVYTYLTDLEMPNLREIVLEGIDLKNSNQFFGGISEWKNLVKIQFLDVLRSDAKAFKPEISSDWTINKYENDESKYLSDILIMKHATY